MARLVVSPALQLHILPTPRNSAFRQDRKHLPRTGTRRSLGRVLQAVRPECSVRLEGSAFQFENFC